MVTNIHDKNWQVLSSSLPVGVKEVVGDGVSAEPSSEAGGEGEGGGETEGEVLIREDLHTAWIPTPQTQQLLSQAQPTKDPNHLTCPALVADVRSVGQLWLCSVGILLIMEAYYQRPDKGRCRKQAREREKYYSEKKSSRIQPGFELRSF